MSTLYVRNFPEELHRKLRELAARNKRSMNDEAIALICKALGEEDVYQKRSAMLKRIAEIRAKHLASPDSVNSLELLREDRER